MRFSFQMLPEQPVRDLVRAVALADELGFYACYSADEIYHKDMWLIFAAAAERTEQIRVGPCVAPVFLRDPAQVAQMAATLDELTSGRAEVVIGIGNIALLEQYAVEWKGTRPIARLREAHHVIRALLDTGELDFAGDFFRYSGVFTAARPVAERVPVKIGAMGGPRSMELAGEVADGLLTACAYSPEALRYAVDCVRTGADRAARDWRALDVGDSVLGAISPDGEAAKEAARVLGAFYLPSMPPGLIERHGLDPAELRPVLDAFAAGDVQRALELTPGEVADRLVVAGSPEEWGERISRDFEPSGLNHLLVSFADPFTVRSWAGRDIEGLPDLEAQMTLLHREVLTQLAEDAV